LEGNLAGVGFVGEVAVRHSNAFVQGRYTRYTRYIVAIE